jgi:AAA+ ATPase superfamily predicted ATPase
MTKFIGRKKELEGLNGLLKKKSASLVVIQGRRRIGKSRLAEEFAKSFLKSYLFTGLPPVKGITAQSQRTEFARQMKEQQIPALERNPNDWGDLFSDVARHCSKGQVLIILDEITWMGDKDATFLAKLKTLWDTAFKKNSQLILLITGSNSTWIEKNILKSTGFLGRVSHLLYLKELPLFRCEEFWGESRKRISAYEKFKLLSVTGGIPRYLEEVRTDLSAEQNIIQLCYRPTGILYNEFEQVFSDLFDRRNGIYKDILKQIIQGRQTTKDIAAGLGRERGGDFSKYLSDIVEAGFLTYDERWNIRNEEEMRQGYYRISDNYVRYYLRYIEPYRSRIKKGNMLSLPKGWKSIMGLQFENLVCKNATGLYKILGLQADEVVWSGPYYQVPGARQSGCQIDYLVQTKHRVLYLCEIKFSENEVPYRVKNEINDKIKRFKIPKGFSLRTVLIHVNGLVESLEHEDYFSSVINFSDFFYGD